MELFPFQAQGDTLADLVQFLPAIAAVVLIVAAMMWFLAWLSRYFEYLKTLESRWIDAETLAFVHRVLEGVWIAFMALIVLAIAQTQSEDLRTVLRDFLLRVPALFVFVFVMFAASLIVRVLHRFAAFLRGELKTKPRRIAPPRALAFTEIVLKYLIYIVALTVAVLGAIRALPAGDQEFIQANFGTLPSPDPALVAEAIIAVVVVFVADRFVESIFEDMKRRTRKFSAHVVDEFKAIARYAVWLISAVVILFLFLDLLLSPERLLVFAIAFVAVLVLLAILAFDAVRNALAGVTLMRADPFDVGDRIKVGDGLVCDVVSMSLTLTQVETVRGERVSIPNTRLVHEPVINFSRSKPYAIFVDVSVGFDVEHNRVHELLLQAAKETGGIVDEPPPEALGKDLTGDTIQYELLAYTNQPQRMREIKSALIYAIQDLFASAGILPRTPRGEPRSVPPGG